MSQKMCVLLVVMSLIVIFSAGCAKRLSGKYVCNQPTLFGVTTEMRLDFKKDGTYIDGTVGLVGTYEIEGKEITLYQEALGTKTAQKGTLEKGAIVMPAMFGDEKMVYQKAK